jgi:HEAT repeat protein
VGIQVELEEGTLKAKIDIQTVMERLADMERQPSLSVLHGLSDLSRDDFLRFQSAWGDLPVARRRWVIHILVQQAEERVELHYTPLLCWLMGDPDAQVRAQAIEGLWEDEDAGLLKPLMRLLHEDADEMVRAAAASAMGRFVVLGELGEIDASIAMGCEKALLATIHTPEESVEVRRRAVEAIAYSSESGVRDLIRNAYYDEDERMRISAVFAMGRSADRHWRNSVLTELQSTLPAMRFEAVRACGELELSDAVLDVGALTEDDDAEVRQAAIWALGRIGGNEARRILLEYADSADDAVSTAADAALDELSFGEDALQFPVYDLDGDDGDDEDKTDPDVWGALDDDR